MDFSYWQQQATTVILGQYRGLLSSDLNAANLWILEYTAKVNVELPVRNRHGKGEQVSGKLSLLAVNVNGIGSDGSTFEVNRKNAHSRIIDAGETHNVSQKQWQICISAFHFNKCRFTYDSSAKCSVIW
jgi:hypothetical protein